MSLTIDQNEDLYFKLSDLQQKLRQSEEERSKLERTCDILLKAFREEEKLRYKALNNKYEKFLEDCRLRRKRNEIILRSLCRVEDKAKALYARTERLKLSKDRFISYIKEREKEPSSLNVLPSSSQPQKNTNDGITSKFVRWKTPLIADYILNRKFSKEEEGFSSSRNNENEFERSELDEHLYKFLVEKYGQRSTNGDNVTRQEVEEKSESHQEQECQKENEGDVFARTSQNKEQKCDDSEKSNPEGSSLINTRSLRRTKTIWKTYFDDDDDGYGQVIKNEKVHNGDVRKELGVMRSFEDRSDEILKNVEAVEEGSVGGVELYGLKEAEALRERGIVKHQESIEKLKVVLEDFGEKKEQDLGRSYVVKTYEYRGDADLNHQIIEKDEIEGNEKTEDNSRETGVGKSPKVVKSFVPGHDAEEFGFEEESERDGVNLDDENDFNDRLPNDAEEAYPMGLDGVDYQNETYPESYYEQPVREHSYTSIASNVILEEDENEVEAEQRETSDESIQNLSFNRHPFQLGEGSVQQQDTGRSRNDEWNDPSVQKNNYPHHQNVKDFGNDPSDRSLAGKQLLKPNRDQDLGRHSPEIARSSREEFKGHDYDFRKISENVETGKVMEADQSSVKSDTSKSEEEKKKKEIETENKLKATSKGLTNFTQSNLAQLLESDSESFQIEHGDLASANEDTDFDFSFHQNSS